MHKNDKREVSTFKYSPVTNYTPKKSTESQAIHITKNESTEERVTG
jgi:hypothetical protein